VARWRDDDNDEWRTIRPKRHGRAPLPRLPHARPASAHVNGYGLAKVTFLSKKAAEVRSKELTAKDGGKRSVYRCKTCSGWHIGGD